MSLDKQDPEKTARVNAMRDELSNHRERLRTDLNEGLREDFRSAMAIRDFPAAREAEERLRRIEIELAGTGEGSQAADGSPRKPEQGGSTDPG